MGYPLPYDRTGLEYLVDDDVINRIVNGFNSDVYKQQIEALKCLNVVWYSSQLKAAYKDQLTDVVRKCRSKEKLKLEIQSTFNLIEANNNEKEHLQKIVEDAVDSYCNYDPVVTNSSDPLSKWASLMECINIHKKRLDVDQQTKIFGHTLSLIDKNRVSLEKNDTGEWLFGMRGFAEEVIRQVSSFLLSLDITKLDEETTSKIKELADWLYSHGYYCLPLLVKYNMKEKTTCSEDILKKVKKAFFSNDSASNNDALHAFFYLVDSELDFSSLLATVFDAIDVSNRDAFNRILILFANLIARGYSDSSFIQKVKDLLSKLQETSHDYKLDAVDLADLQGYANYVAGALSYSLNKDSQPVFGFEESQFNDVVVWFDKGVALAIYEGKIRDSSNSH